MCPIYCHVNIYKYIIPFSAYITFEHVSVHEIFDVSILNLDITHRENITVYYG